MTDNITKPNACNKTNDLLSACEEDISENPWVVGVSKTHPGLKYYFNKITGVSLWNICNEDMERAKQSMNGSQSQYISCPEPNEPPPSKGAPTKLPICDVSRYSKPYNNQLVNRGLAHNSSGYACDVMYNSTNTQPNIITVNIQPFPSSACITPLQSTYGTLAQSKFQSSLTEIDMLTYEKNQFNANVNHLCGNKATVNTSIAEIMVQGSSKEHTNSQSSADGDLFYDTSHFESFDLASLRRLAQINVTKDKWFIIADSNIYLHHIHFLKSIMNSDNQCCLKLPRNVKPELERACKGPHRTKAYYAIYYIYRMFDNGCAVIDDDHFDHMQNKSNEKHIIDCWSTLKDQNYYMVVISNDLELQKYRNKIYIPIFTVAQLKEYLYKSDQSVTTESSEPSFNSSQIAKNVTVSVPNNFSVRNPINSNSNVTETQNQNVQTTQLLNDVGTQVGPPTLFERTADAEVQTSFSHIQSEGTDNTCLSNQSNRSKEKEILLNQSQSCEPRLQSVIRSSGIKLKRRKVGGQKITDFSTKLVSSDANTSNALITTDANAAPNKVLEEQCNIINSNNNAKRNEISKPETNENITNEGTQNPSEDIKSNQNFKKNESIICQPNSQHKNIEIKNVMFEVSSDIMDQNLRRKSDEWLSRFIQVMEEVLTQVLRKSSALYFPPPWNMYEMAMCVGKRFKDDEDITDASKKFLKMLNTISDEKGNINAKISPSQYMEMYSFGVYVVDALQGMFSTCDDLQAATESLSKLLSDIQDPEADVCNVESFQGSGSFQDENIINNTDDSNDKVEVLMIVETESVFSEKSEAVSETNHEFHESKDKWSNNNYCVTKETTCTSTPPQGTPANCAATGITSAIASSISPSSYDLRSTLKRMSLVDQEKVSSPPPYIPQQVIKNSFSKSTCLSNFLLNKNNIFSDGNVSKSFENDYVSDDVHCMREIEIDEQYSQPSSSHASDVSNNTFNKPKIVKNFVICSEFEDRLRKRQVHNEIEDFYFDDESRAMGFMDADETSCDTGRLHIDGYAEFQGMDDSIEQDLNYKIDSKYFIRRIGQEIQGMATEVYTFSKNTCESLTSSSVVDKSGIREKAEKLHVHLDQLSVALTNLLRREKNGGHILEAILKNNFVYDLLIEEDQIKMYGAFIAQGLELTESLRKTVKDVLSAVCEV